MHTCLLLIIFLLEASHMATSTINEIGKYYLAVSPKRSEKHEFG